MLKIVSLFWYTFSDQTGILYGSPKLQKIRKYVTMAYDIKTTAAHGGLKTRRVIDQAYHNYFLCANFFWWSGRVSS